MTLKCKELFGISGHNSGKTFLIIYKYHNYEFYRAAIDIEGKICEKVEVIMDNKITP